MDGRKEVTARGIISIGGSVLVAQGKNDPFTHLPGGHVEAGESPLTSSPAFRPGRMSNRELQEELGRSASEVRPVTVIENIFDKGATRIHETLHLFAVKLYPELRAVPARSAEDHLTFRWISIGDMDRERLLPPSVYPWVRLIGGKKSI